MNMLAHFDSPLVLARHLTSVSSLVTKTHKICTQIGFFSHLTELIMTNRALLG